MSIGGYRWARFRKKKNKNKGGDSRIAVPLSGAVKKKHTCKAIH